MAPGRLVAPFGTGYTSRSVLGQKPVGWAELTRYVRQVRALVRGEIVEIDGQPCQMMHLIAHQCHLSSLTDRDRDLVAAAGSALLRVGWSGDPAAIREHLARAGEAGSPRSSTSRPARTSPVNSRVSPPSRADER